MAAARRARSGPLPDGLYWTDVVAAAAGRQDPSDQRSPAQVKFAFVIAEGDYRGRRLWLNIGVANDAGMRVLGDCMNLLGLANMADLLEVLPQLAGVRWQVQCKTVTQENGKEYRNVYPRARGADGRDMPALLAQMRLLQPEHSWPFAS